MRIARTEKTLTAWAVTQEDAEFIRPLGFTQVSAQGHWEAPYSEDALYEIVFHGNVDIDKELQACLTSKSHWDSLTPLDVPSKREPKPYQKIGNRILSENPTCEIAWDMGLGKSKPVVDVASDLIRRGEATNVVVIAPGSVVPAWTSKKDGHVIADSEYGSVDLLAATAAQRKKKLKVGLADENNKFFVVNYEGFPIVSGEMESLGVISEKTIFVLDEAHKVKNYTTKTFKQLYSFVKKFGIKRVWLLTGTPITQRLQDIYGQAAMVDESVFGKPTWGEHEQFLNTYCLRKTVRTRQHHEFQVVTGYQNVAQYMFNLHRFCHRLKKTDVLKDLPPIVYSTVRLEMEKRVAGKYREVVDAYDRFIQQLKDKRDGTDPNPLQDPVFEYEFKIDKAGEEFSLMKTNDLPVALQKAREILNNWVYLESVGEDGKTRRTINRIFSGYKCPKMDFIIQTLEEQQCPAVVWYSFKGERALISDALTKAGISHVYLDGDIPSHKRGEVIDKFREGKVQVILAHPAAAGMGIDFRRAKIMFYYSNLYDVASRDQSEARAHRLGVLHSVLCIDLIYEGTIEEAIYNNIKNKKDFSAMVVDKSLSPETALQLLTGHIFGSEKSGRLKVA